MRLFAGSGLLIFLLSLLIASAFGEETGVSFCREEVSIAVAEGCVLFDGLYCFENISALPCSLRLFYRFPLDSLHPLPDTVTVTCGYLDLEYEDGEGGISFIVWMPMESCASVRIAYKQVCLEPTFCYRFKSITAWDEPIEEADVEIWIPSRTELEWISYEIRDVSEHEGSTVYKFSCKDCMPSEDLCLRWRSFE